LHNAEKPLIGNVDKFIGQWQGARDTKISTLKLRAEALGRAHLSREVIPTPPTYRVAQAFRAQNLPFLIDLY
jgi:hypothetical protein